MTFSLELCASVLADYFTCVHVILLSCQTVTVFQSVVIFSTDNCEFNLKYKLYCAIHRHHISHIQKGIAFLEAFSNQRWMMICSDQNWAIKTGKRRACVYSFLQVDSTATGTVNADIVLTNSGLWVCCCSRVNVSLCVLCLLHNEWEDVCVCLCWDKTVVMSGVSAAVIIADHSADDSRELHSQRTNTSKFPTSLL